MNNWQLGNIFFDTTRRMLVVDTQQIYLEPRIFELLQALLTADQQQLSREQLIAQVWQGRVVSESAINRAVSLLRRAFSQLDESQPYLETLPKVGYRLLVPVTMLQPVTEPVTESGHEPAAEMLVQTAAGLESDDEPINTKVNLLQRIGWWLPAMLLVLVLSNVYWQQLDVTPGSAQLPTPVVAAPTPRTSDEGVEFQLSLSRDGQWFSYLQQDARQVRWFLQPTGGATESSIVQPRLQVNVPDGTLRFASLSPDCSWLLYELCQQQECKLWLKASPIAPDADSTSFAAKPDQLLLQLPFDSQLQISWQQDSQAFYFRQRPDKTKPYALSRLELATRAIQQLTQPVTPGGDAALAISADASKLAVVSYLQQTTSVLRVYQRQNMTLLAEQEVPYAVTTIAWQNDQQLLFGCGEQICRWEVAAKQVQPLFYAGAPVQSLFWQAGQFWYGTLQQKMEIWRQQRPSGAEGDGNWPAPQKVIASSRIDWMPRIAGEDLVFLTNRRGEQQIWRQAAGQIEQFVATLPPPAEFVRLALSADGKELIFSQQGAIYLLEITSGKLHQILDASAKAMVVNFGANAGQLIYSSTQSGDWQLWSLDRTTGKSSQLTTQGGYSGYIWQGELWYSKYHQNGLYRLGSDGEEQQMLADFDKINWLNWQLSNGELYFY